MNDHKTHNYENIKVLEILGFLYSRKNFLILVSFVGSFLVGVGSLFIKDTYQSNAILAPNIDSSTQISSGFNGLASIAGISIPQESNKLEKGMEIVKSLYFFQDLSQNEEFFFNLVATNGWDHEKNELLVDDEVFDTSNKRWVSKGRFSIEGRPTLQSAHRTFLDYLTISKDTKTGFYVITFSHYSPYFAKDALDLVLNNINELSRNEDIAIYQSQVNFLYEEASKMQYNQIREGINSLIEDQIQLISIAKTSPEYLFKVLSKPYAPELESGPNRLAIVVLAAFFIFVLSSIYVIFRELKLSSDSG